MSVLEIFSGNADDAQLPLIADRLAGVRLLLLLTQIGLELLPLADAVTLK